MYLRRVILRTGLAAMAIVMGADLADAASAVCNSLTAQLAAVQRSAAGAGKAAAFQNAAAQQQAAIATTEAQARRAGCYGGFLFQPKAQPQCPAIMARLGKMRSNLAKLENRRQNLGIDPASASRQKAALLSQLGANNCGPQYAGYAPQQRGFFARLFNPQPAIQPVAVPSGGLTELRPQTRRTASASSGDYDVGFGRGAYRTLCVRTCDGYYFPIHYSANRSTFATDEQICRQMCPGTDVALYAHRNPGQDASQALSTTDETRYTDLPNAFAYRTTFNPSCTCGKATLSDAVAGGYTPADISTFAQASPPLPATAPTLGEDPETIANRNGQLDPVEIGKPNVAAPIASLSLPSGGAVRRVGPSYYYAQ